MANLFKQLQFLRHIQPDASFAARSRAIIVGTQKQSSFLVRLRQQLYQTLTLGGALAIAVILLFVLGNVSRLRLDGFSPGLIISLNDADLHAEKQKAQLQLQLAQAKYYRDSADQITMAIGSLAGRNGIAFDQEVIQRHREQIDALLQELTL